MSEGSVHSGLLLPLQLGCQAAPEQCDMLSTEAAVLLLYDSCCCHPAVDACDTLQEVHVMEGTHHGLKLLQTGLLLHVLLLVLVVLQHSAGQLLAEPSLMPVVLRRQHSCMLLLLLLMEQQVLLLLLGFCCCCCCRVRCCKLCWSFTSRCRCSAAYVSIRFGFIRIKDVIFRP